MVKNPSPPNTKVPAGWIWELDAPGVNSRGGHSSTTFPFSSKLRTHFSDFFATSKLYTPEVYTLEIETFVTMILLSLLDECFLILKLIFDKIWLNSNWTGLVSLARWDSFNLAAAQISLSDDVTSSIA